MFSYLAYIKNFSKNAKIFLLGNFLFSFSISFFGLLFNLYLKKKGLSESEVGTILSSAAFGATTMSLLSCFFASSIKSKWSISFSVLGIAIGQILQIHFDKIFFIQISSFITGMFTALLAVTAAPFLVRNSDESERVHLFSFYFASNIFAQFVGFYIAGLTPKFLTMCFGDFQFEGLPQSVFVGSFLALLTSFFFLKLTQSPRPKLPFHFLKNLQQASWRQLLPLMWPKLILGMGAGMIIPFLNLYLKQVFNLSTHSIGIFFSIQQIFVFVGMISIPLVVSRLGKLGSIITTASLSIPFMLAMALTTSWQVCVVAFCFRGMLMNMSGPIYSIFEIDYVNPQDQNLISSLTYFSWNLGWSFSSRWSGHIIQEYSFAYSFYAAIFLYVITIISYRILFWHKKNNFKTPSSLFSH